MIQIAEDIDLVMQQAQEAFLAYRKCSASDKAAFLKAIVAQIEALGDTLIQTAMEESNLPLARLTGERGRTTGQLLAFAKLLEAGDWVQASIDTGDPDRKPVAKPDLRKMMQPVGPVVVFGASNFPLAFSTAGGDTASALAAGCSVVVKSHPGHPRTSLLVAGAINKAIAQSNVPEHVFQHVADHSIQAGQSLILHPVTKAAAFTGSYTGGKALFDLANQREEPIPFFAEMGSINPVVVLPEVLQTKKDLPATLASSIMLGVGQFCTNPGLILVLEESGLDEFLDGLSTTILAGSGGKMLHTGIASSYKTRKKEALSQDGITTLATVVSVQEDDITGTPAIATVSASDFIDNSVLKEEVFGPYSLIVKCKSKEELSAVITSLKGQLTATLFGTEQELGNYTDIAELLIQRCGRLIYNGVPTGVEVCKSMQHGGPFPSTTDSRFTSVGTDAIYRFVRPVSYQDCPDAFLPVELRNENTLSIMRVINGIWTNNSIKIR
ncbi:aldehyde dehydrogenase (NADP(+)) [Xanthocytophaga agilis]|uniref:Aldehyde dehydrogenase (NADP(+)) n=1 Tax=Xanthocytophaga agilis TaxID=3048010 RepID=A0AAE3R3B3_9BACT|nr:aldehyde dehydrogenase (NADP(+)) [Xanthocytophaga agilis]MDJ1502964.1 aldehyde dehydrogenase (NADP(+)) [Xanthocytophaga agilis]